MLIRLLVASCSARLSYSPFELVGFEPTTRWVDEEILIYATAKTFHTTGTC